MKTEVLIADARERLGKYWQFPTEVTQADVRKKMFDLARMHGQEELNNAHRMELFWAFEHRTTVVSVPRQLSELSLRLCEEHQRLVETAPDGEPETVRLLGQLELLLCYIEKAEAAVVPPTHTIDGELTAMIATYDALALQRRIMLQESSGEAAEVYEIAAAA